MEADGSSGGKTSLSKPSVVSGYTSSGGSMIAQLIVIPARQSEIILVAGDKEGDSRGKKFQIGVCRKSIQ